MALPKLLLSLSSNLTFTVLGILGIGFIIGFHELGHFIFCKIFNVRTNRFAIGFGPKLLQRKIGQTDFTLSAVPIGGFVEMATESPKGPQDPTLFAKKPLYQKLFIIGGGIIFNILFAMMTLFFILLTGIPKTRLLYPLSTSTVVSEVRKGSPAEKYGLKIGDAVTAIDDKPLGDSAELLFKTIKTMGDQKINLSIVRKGREKILNVALGTRQVLGNDYGDLGAAFTLAEKPGMGLIKSAVRGVKLTWAYLLNTMRAYKYILVKRDTSGMGGPIMIISETIKGAAKGFKIFLLFLAIISINLAVLNMIPLPILDGGQALLFTIEGIIRRQLPERTKEIIFIICWIGIFALIIFLSAKDIWRIIAPWVKSVKSYFAGV